MHRKQLPEILKLVKVALIDPSFFNVKNFFKVVYVKPFEKWRR